MKLRAFYWVIAFSCTCLLMVYILLHCFSSFCLLFVVMLTLFLCKVCKISSAQFLYLVDGHASLIPMFDHSFPGLLITCGGF